MRILVTGEEQRVKELRARFVALPDVTVDYTDGDEEEDYEAYDAIFDLNLDDDPTLLPRYASLKEKPVLVNAVKTTLAEMVYATDAKIKCRLFGINALPGFLEHPLWEMSAYRRFEYPMLESILQTLRLNYAPVADRVGMVKPRVIFMIINEACYTLQEGTASIEDIDQSMKLGTHYPYGPFEWCDKIGITTVFETLTALYDDTHDERYRICPLLKHKYLRNETFYKSK